MSFNWRGSFLAVLAGACATSRSSPPDLPGEPRPADISTATTGPWSFARASGTIAYRITRSASIEGMADSVLRREVVSNFTHQILTLEPAGEEMAFRAVVDTFALTTQGVVGPAQLVELPVELSGTVGSTGVRIESPANGSCNAARATVATDLYNLLTPFPSRLSKGAVWRDSTSVSGCQAGIPTTATSKRTFTVAGEVAHSGRLLLLVQRADSVTARGEGAYGQHRMLVEGTGVGSALYYLDTISGEVSQLTTSQRSWIKVVTSGRVHSFTQTTNQEFVRVR